MAFYMPSPGHGAVLTPFVGARWPLRGIGKDAKHTKGMNRQRTQKAWRHTAHRGWARLLLNCARDLIINHDPAHRGANGAAMPMDENDQDGHFFFNHPERGGQL